MKFRQFLIVQALFSILGICFTDMCGHGQNNPGAFFGQQERHRHAADFEVSLFPIQCDIQALTKVRAHVDVIVDSKDCYLGQEVLEDSAEYLAEVAKYESILT